MVDVAEQKKLTDKIEDLIGKANGYEQIKSYFNDNEDIQKYYKEAYYKCNKDGCFSEAIVFITAIELLLERIDD